MTDTPQTPEERAARVFPAGSLEQFTAEIRAAEQAAAARALREAAEEALEKWGYGVANWLRARAAQIEEGVTDEEIAESREAQEELRPERQP